MEIGMKCPIDAEEAAFLRDGVRTVFAWQHEFTRSPIASRGGGDCGYMVCVTPGVTVDTITNA
jgi:hypothetical protein